MSKPQYESIDVVVGGQFGSESKGRVAAELVRRRAEEFPDNRAVSVRVGGPNAGHVVIDDNGRKFAMRQIPVGFVVPGTVLVIAPGSEVDPEVLWDEIHMLEDAGFEVRSRLFVSPEATVLTKGHQKQEQKLGLAGRVGSTAKGIGAARADRLWRTADRVQDCKDLFEDLHLFDVVTPSIHAPVVIEGTQGYGLGLHAGYYPQCTSGNARAVDFLAQAGVNPWDTPAEQFHVHVVVRPYPIRVAGNSGPLVNETSWEDLGLEQERTTVTQKVRRVGQFDPEIVRQAVQANGSRSLIHLAMADQLDPSLTGHTDSSRLDVRRTTPEFRRIMGELSSIGTVIALGTSPDTTMWLDR